MTIVATDVDVTADTIFDRWLGLFGEALTSQDFAAAARCFTLDGYWKDALAFTWAFRTFGPGRDIVGSALAERVPTLSPKAFRRSDHHTGPRLSGWLGQQVVEGFFTFETAVGVGTGFVRLDLDESDPRSATASIVFTTLRELHGVEEKIGDRRPTGLEYSYDFGGDNWLDKRRSATEYSDRDPEVIIIGGGQSGLALAAVCGQHDLDTLLIEKTPRIGDSWRDRYHSLTLHNEIFSNDLPYLPFPETWPIFVPKDKFAGWLEYYAEAMELNVWTGSEVVACTYDDATELWTALVRRADGTERTIRAPHVVMAGGSVCSVPNVPRLPGLAEFTGKVVHSQAFGDGRDYGAVRALVVGTGTSGHDAAQTLHANGAESVTIVQRDPTCVMSLVPAAEALYSPYRQGLPIDDMDLIWMATPHPVLIQAAQAFTKVTCEMDRDILDGLEAVGFETDFGPDETGLQFKYLRHGGKYYINVGCSDLIMDGSIGLVHTRDLERFTADGLLMSDGTLIPLDLVVLATGYRNQQEGIRMLFGDEVAERVGLVGGLDETGETRAMWKQTGQPGMWVAGGNLMDVRQKPRWLALQIKASLQGILPAVVEG